MILTTLIAIVTNLHQGIQHSRTFSLEMKMFKNITFEQILSLVKSKAFTLTTYDKKIDSIEAFTWVNNKLQLHSTIVLKQNMLIELIEGNYAIEDGLVNGVEGIFRHYTEGKNDIVWIEFADRNVGLIQRTKMQNFFTSNIPQNWTPMTRICRKIRKKNRVNFIRQQFPIQLACARTIHRSQGLTMNMLAFDPKGVKQHGLVYTTLSRVTNIQSLCLVTRLHQTNFSCCKKVLLEVDRLRKNAKYELQYGLTAIVNENCFLICSLNT